MKVDKGNTTLTGEKLYSAFDSKAVPCGWLQCVLFPKLRFCFPTRRKGPPSFFTHFFIPHSPSQMASPRHLEDENDSPVFQLCL